MSETVPEYHNPVPGAAHTVGSAMETSHAQANPAYYPPEAPAEEPADDEEAPEE